MSKTEHVSLSTFYAILVKRVYPLIDRNPTYIDKYIDRMKSILNDNPKLKKVFDISKDLYRITLDIADAMYESFNPVVDKVPLDDQLKDLYEYSMKIVSIKSNIISFINKLKTGDFLFGDSDNDKIATFLALQDCTIYAAAKDNELNQLIKTLNQQRKMISDDINQLKKYLRSIIKDLKQKMRTLNEGLIGNFFSIIKDKVKDILKKAYRIYKRLAIIILAIQFKIRNRIIRAKQAFINKLSGGDPIISMILGIIISIMIGKGSLYVKNAYGTKIYNVLQPLIGPVSGVVAISGIILFINKIETQSTQTLQSFMRGADSLLSQLESIDV